MASGQSRREYRLVCDAQTREHAIEREIIASYQIAQSFGFRGDFRAWEHLLRIHE